MGVACKKSHPACVFLHRQLSERFRTILYHFYGDFFSSFNGILVNPFTVNLLRDFRTILYNFYICSVDQKAIYHKR